MSIIKTLIIHPEDDSTTFLCSIYAEIRENQRTLITGGISKQEVADLIQSHQQIILCGHGSPDGLFAISKFTNTSYTDFIIDSDMVALLKQNKKVIAIWCYAANFIKKHQITNAYFSEMFISEMIEAIIFEPTPVEEFQITESNDCFAKELAGNLHLSPEEIHNNLQQGLYSQMATKNPIAKYNMNRLGFSL